MAAASVTPYDTAHGLRYRVRYRKPDGSQTDKRGFMTKTAAEAWAVDNNYALQHGRYVDPTAGKVTIGDLAKSWTNSRVDLKESAGVRNQYSLDGQVLPYWKHKPVSEVTAAAGRNWIAALNKKYSPSTVHKAFYVMKAILDEAVLDQRIPTNPITKLALPRIPSPDHIFLTAEQLFELSENAKGRDDIILTLGFTGLRWGELAGLKCKRWNSERRRLTVAEQVTEINGNLAWGTVKNHQARTVPVPELIAELLDARVAGKKPNEVIFSTPKGGVLRNKNARRDWFDAAVLATFPPEVEPEQGEKPMPSIPLTPHDLRHTAASLAAAAGANAKSVQKMLGHASAAMTHDIYVGLFEDDLDAVASRLDTTMGKMHRNLPNNVVSLTERRRG
jgi:integrase